MEPDGIYSWDLPPEKRKPSPYALEDIMNRYHLSPDQLLMVDDMKPGMDMAHACGVAFAAAGWSCGIPEIEKDLRQKSEFYLKTVDESSISSF